MMCNIIITMNSGFAPLLAGGPGKNETVREMAMRYGVQCFKVEPGNEWTQMARFFKGVATCGSWVNFVKANEYSLRLLTTISEFIIQIQGSIRR